MIILKLTCKWRGCFFQKAHHVDEFNGWERDPAVSQTELRMKMVRRQDFCSFLVSCTHVFGNSTSTFPSKHPIPSSLSCQWVRWASPHPNSRSRCVMQAWPIGIFQALSCHNWSGMSVLWVRPISDTLPITPMGWIYLTTERLKGGKTNPDDTLIAPVPVLLFQDSQGKKHVHHPPYLFHSKLKLDSCWRKRPGDTMRQAQKPGYKRWHWSRGSQYHLTNCYRAPTRLWYHDRRWKYKDK